MATAGAIFLSGRAALTLARSAEGLLPALLPGLLVLGAMLFLFRFMLFGTARRGGGGNVGRGLSTGGSLIGRAVMSTARASGSALVRSGKAGGAIEDAYTEVRRFRIVTANGDKIDCELIGEVSGPSLRQGDPVEVHGRQNRRGVVRARKVTLTASGAYVTARLPLAFRTARWAGVAALGVVGAGVVLVVLR